MFLIREAIIVIPKKILRWDIVPTGGGGYDQISTSLTVHWICACTQLKKTESNFYGKGITWLWCVLWIYINYCKGSHHIIFFYLRWDIVPTGGGGSDQIPTSLVDDYWVKHGDGNPLRMSQVRQGGGVWAGWDNVPMKGFFLYHGFP